MGSAAVAQRQRQAAAFARAASGQVIASGGAKDISDIQSCLDHAGDGITGIITGRAIYEGTLDLVEAIELTKSRARG